MSDQPTVEEIAKVRRFECSVNGHTYTEVETMGSDGPVRVVCTNCGRSWRVCRCDQCTEEP
jgi:hypothetical protein